MKYQKPTGDECTQRARVVAYEDRGETRMGYACWYPQMGGYVGACVVVFDEPQTDSNQCFSAIVWHDGEFPFGDDDGEEPRVLHHCAAEQFVRFSNHVAEMQAKHAPLAKAKA